MKITINVNVKIVSIFKKDKAPIYIGSVSEEAVEEAKIKLMENLNCEYEDINRNFLFVPTNLGELIL